VRADRLQIDQVVMNLVVNARDAMPNGGRLTIDTGRIMLSADQAARLEGLTPGRYVTLRVSDSGIGMDDEVRAKLFEPFFTTKERGEGTGLGLSTAYGIIQQSGGAIDVESEPGQGATFTIYLPSVDAAVTEPITRPQLDREMGGNETVLLAEDEGVVRDLMSELLQGAGYHVLEAQSGRAALEVAEAFAEPIHLLLTDVIMPGMSGRELAGKIAARRPETRVLYVSGYTRDLIAQQGILEPGVHLLQKPFDPDVLLQKIREVLDGPRLRAA
jgi:CheY-like chemotaxis protein